MNLTEHLRALAAPPQKHTMELLALLKSGSGVFWYCDQGHSGIIRAPIAVYSVGTGELITKQYIRKSLCPQCTPAAAGLLDALFADARA